MYIKIVSQTLLFHMKSTVVRASHYQCQSRNSPGFVPSILWPSRIWGGGRWSSVEQSTLKKIHVFAFPAVMVRVHPWWKYEKETKVEVVIKLELESAVQRGGPYPISLLFSLLLYIYDHFTPLGLLLTTGIHQVSCKIPCLDILIFFTFIYW